MADLKPCPFCGQPVDYTHTAGSYGYYPATIAVGCKPCGYKLPAQPLEDWHHGAAPTTPPSKRQRRSRLRGTDEARRTSR